MTSPARPQADWELPARFVAVGLVNTAFGYLVFAALVVSGLGPGPAVVLSTAAGVAFNFQTLRRIVFRSKGRLARFALVYGGVLALNWTMLGVARHYGLPDLGVQLVLAPPLAALSFVCLRTFVFGPVEDEA